MEKDLTKSDIQRQNILNNRYAIKAIENDLALGGIVFENDIVFTKQQVATIFEVDERTIDNYIANHNAELIKNGYTLVRGEKLKQFKDLVHVNENDFVELNLKIPSLGLFSFRAVLNLAMLITVSDKAKYIRSRILDLAISSISQKVKDRTFINQRDGDYLPSAFQEENYRKEFTTAINNYIDTESKWKYAKYTNMVYQAIFAEGAAEYREILRLQERQNIRDTFYSEVLDLISSFEAGFAEELKEESEKLRRKLTQTETDNLFAKFAQKAAFKPFIAKARTIMASRDYNLRDAIHNRLESYIQAMPEADYEKFLGEKSKDLEERIKEDLEVYKRLKDR